MDKESNLLDIAPGMSVEEMVALFFDKAALVEQPEKVWRLQNGNDRLYYTVDEKGEPTFFVSVTTLIRQTTPTSPHLIKWIAEMGYEQSKQYTAERAAYGTFMHTEIANLLINKQLDLDAMKERLRDYAEVNNLPHGFVDANIDPLRKDLLAFAQFVVDYKVRPLAIEVVLTHESGYAGAIDLPCVMEIQQEGFWGEVYKSGKNKGEPKKTKKPIDVVAIVDFKSGRKGFFEDHEIQLEGYRRMWNAKFPDKAAERIYNWAPNDWRGSTPTYKLKDQTGSANIAKFDHLVNIAAIEGEKREKTVTVVSGTIDLNDIDVSKNIEVINITDLVKSKVQPND